MARPPNSTPPRPRPEPGGGGHQRNSIVGDEARLVQPLALDTRGLARALGVSARHIAALRAQGRLPAPVRLGKRVVWPRSEIEAWLAAGAPSLDRWQEMRSREGGRQ